MRQFKANIAWMVLGWWTFKCVCWPWPPSKMATITRRIFNIGPYRKIFFFLTSFYQRGTSFFSHFVSNEFACLMFVLLNICRDIYTKNIKNLYLRYPYLRYHEYNSNSVAMDKFKWQLMVLIFHIEIEGMSLVCNRTKFIRCIDIDNLYFKTLNAKVKWDWLINVCLNLVFIGYIILCWFFYEYSCSLIFIARWVR